uniref:Uncharacterized protein n=1 Tax=Setaria digitata TaxID=48799 RepID=A0A915Q7H1_9BILA
MKLSTIINRSNITAKEQLGTHTHTQTKLEIFNPARDAWIRALAWLQRAIRMEHRAVIVEGKSEIVKEIPARSMVRESRAEGRGQNKHRTDGRRQPYPTTPPSPSSSSSPSPCRRHRHLDHHYRCIPAATVCAPSICATALPMT